MNEKKKYKHMLLEDRIEIQECLCKGMTFKAIARRIGKDPTTLSKEVKLHAVNYHAIQAHELTVSKSTVYRHIQNGYYQVSRIDLPSSLAETKRMSLFRKESRLVGLMRVFLVFIEENPSCCYAEMDTMIGRIGGKVIMTFQFVNPDFMFGLLLNDKSSAEAADKIRALKQTLADTGFSFAQLFPVLLTDNGGEFANVFAFENDLTGTKETSVFYCDPNCSYQKPHVENNHSLFRSIVQKGESFDSFTQDTVNLIFSHVNSVKRLQFNGKIAFDMFSFLYSAELANLLGIAEIPAKQVGQSPLLLAESLQN